MEISFKQAREMGIPVAADEADDDYMEIIIKVNCKGYYDPGCWYLRNGDPGYPPEGDEERLIDAIGTIQPNKQAWNGKAFVRFPKELEDKLAEHPIITKYIEDYDLYYPTEEDLMPDFEDDEPAGTYNYEGLDDV
jgi:uncharacterized protein YneR